MDSVSGRNWASDRLLVERRRLPGDALSHQPRAEDDEADAAQDEERLAEELVERSSTSHWRKLRGVNEKQKVDDQEAAAEEGQAVGRVGRRP